MTELETKLLQFLQSKNLKTRNGVPFKVNGVQKDPQGNISFIAGTVNVDGEDVSVLWNANCCAQCVPQLIYDLVVEESFEDWIKTKEV